MIDPNEIIEAVKFKKPADIANLIKNGADPNLISGTESLLDLAIRYRKKNNFCALILGGAIPDNKWAMTIFLTQINWTTAATIVIKKFNLQPLLNNTTRPVIQGGNILIGALTCENLNFLKFLLKSGAKISANNCEKYFYNTLYDLKNEKILNYFIVNNLIDVNKTINDTQDGSFFFFRHADYSIESVKLIISRCRDINRKDHLLGWTWLMKAALSNNILMLQELLNHGADVNVQDNRGRSILELCDEFKQIHAKNIIQAFIDKQSIADVVLASGDNNFKKIRI